MTLSPLIASRTGRSDALMGVFRSLRTYYGDKDRQNRMDQIYATFLDDKALAFDIGSHVGDRVASFRRLGAHVVALEPQPLLYRTIRLIHGRDQAVTIKQQACGAKMGTIPFFVNSKNPTVSSASSDFVAAADGCAGWDDQAWDMKIDVPITTLDHLIAAYGVPDFVKIDVEGFEYETLKGLTQPLRALSFEFTTIQKDIAFCCVDYLKHLGNYHFNIILGEAYQWMANKRVSAAEIKNRIQSLPHEANSGDIYAILN